MTDQGAGLLKIVEESQAQTLALQAVCAALMAHIATLDKTPRAKLAEITTGLQAVAHGIALLAGTNSPESTSAIMITKTIDAICSMAESLLVISPSDR